MLVLSPQLAAMRTMGWKIAGASSFLLFFLNVNLIVWCILYANTPLFQRSLPHPHQDFLSIVYVCVNSLLCGAETHPIREVHTVHTQTVTAPSAQEAQPSDDRKQPSPWRQQSELVSYRSNTGAHIHTRNLMPSEGEAARKKSKRWKRVRKELMHKSLPCLYRP